MEVVAIEPYERIRHLRKDILKLNQNEFASQINISRSNLGNIETKKINLTERVITDVCRAFRVSHEWVADGTGEIFCENRRILDEEIAMLYAELTDDNKKYVYGYIQRLLEEQSEN